MMENKGKILVVDDLEHAVRMSETFLASAGYDVAIARNGQEAVDRAREAMPDLILMDCLMPEMDGFEATRALKGDPATAGIPIVLLTSLDSVEDRVRGIRAGADDFLAKTFSQVEILVRVGSFIELKRLKERTRALDEALAAVGVGGRAEETGPDTVMIVQSDMAARAEMAAELGRQGYTVSVAATGSEALAGIGSAPPKIVLIDVRLPDMPGVDLVRELKKRLAFEEVPVVLVSRIEELDFDAIGMESGADEYLLKPVNPVEMLARVRNLLRKSAMQRRLRAAMDAAFQRATTDPMTGLYNIQFLRGVIDKEIAAARRYGQGFSLMVLDIDRFKSINDTLGHLAGDAMIRGLAGILSRLTRSCDYVARYGGDEFVVFLPVTGVQESVIVGERLRAAVEKTDFAAAGGGRRITISVGVTGYREGDTSADAIIKRADEGLYESKRGGRNRVTKA